VHCLEVIIARNEQRVVEETMATYQFEEWYRSRMSPRMAEVIRTKPDVLQFVEYVMVDEVSKIEINLDNLSLSLYNPGNDITLVVSFEEIEELSDSVKEFARQTIKQLKGEEVDG
jgi:hypothetical protein